jgi:hypothetical protein
MADIVDEHVIMLASAERGGYERLLRAKYVEHGHLALPFGDVPMFNANTRAAVGIWPAHDSACPKTPGALV